MVGSKRQLGARKIPHVGPHAISSPKPNQGKILANKLRLTSLVLGCSTNKELCARFAAINPATAFIAQNAYKWLGGKAMPRVSSVYEDWAQVLGGGVSAPFIASSSFDEFAAALSKLFLVPEGALAELRENIGPPPTLRSDGAPDVNDMASSLRPSDQMLIGNYLAISPAWSRGEAGRLIVGFAKIEIDVARSLQITYCERLFNRLIVMCGAMVGDGRSAQSAMTCTYTRRLMFLALQVPPPPANLIGGILSGAAIHDHEARSLAARIALVRSHGDEGTLSELSGYIDAQHSLVAKKLETLGYTASEETQQAAKHLVSFLTAPSSGLLEASPEILGNLGLTLDRLIAA